MMKRRGFMKGVIGLGCAAVGVKAVAETKKIVAPGYAIDGSDFVEAKSDDDGLTITLPAKPSPEHRYTITAGERPVTICSPCGGTLCLMEPGTSFKLTAGVCI